MLHGRRLATLLAIVVLFNPSQIESRKIRRTRDNNEDRDQMAGILRAPIQRKDKTNLQNGVTAAFEHAQHHHLHERQLQEKPVIHHTEEPGQGDQKHGVEYHHDNTESGSSLEKNGEIHVESLDRHVREDGEERDDFSGDVGRHVEIRDLHYHVHKSDSTGETPDDEDSKHQSPKKKSHSERLHFHHKTPRGSSHHQLADDHEGSSGWEHFEMHLHSHGKRENNDEFGYVTDEEEAELPEENEDGALSGERDYDHEHLKTLHVHRDESHVKKPRDSLMDEEGNEEEVAGKLDDEFSGEGHVHHRTKHVKKKHDSHVKGERIEQEMTEEDDKDDGYSGNVGDNAYHRRDVYSSQRQEVAESKSKERKKNVSAEEQSKENESGEDEGPSGEQLERFPKHSKDNQLHSQDDKRKKAAISQKLFKPQSGKQGHPSSGEHSSKHSEELKVHVRINVTHTKVLKSKVNEKGDSMISILNKSRKQQKQKGADLATKGSSKADDFYIAENDDPEEKLHEVEMVNINDGKKIADYGKGKIGKQTQGEDKKVETVRRYTRGSSRHLLQITNEKPTSDYIPVSFTQCTHPAFADTVADDNIVYIRAECRLCQCKMGELICGQKPQFCDQQLAKMPCAMEKGGEMADGERHFDGCNHCLCRNSELLCTRLRCPSANYNYTDYQLNSNDTLQNATKADVNEGRMRGKDPCMECDYEPISPVCGLNWKTYRSMCHALYCGGLKIEQVKQGTCEVMNPCDEAKCAEHEICLVRKRGPCLASRTTDQDPVECQQYQCVNPTQNCSSIVDRKVCGEDHKTYSSECAMFAQGIALAYYGECKEECTEEDSRMCGVDGVTFASSCHAALLNSHVDYPGECDNVDPKNNLPISSSDTEGDSRRCKTVKELARCPVTDCTKYVISEGSCCLTCGTAISIRLDTAARDMTTLKTAQDQPNQPSYHLNRLGLIHTTLKALSNRFGGLDKCQLTEDLVDNNDVSVVYKSMKPEDEDACDEVARKTVEFINSPAKNDAEPGEAVLAAAVVVEHSEMTFVPEVMSVMSKRRKKRSKHHEHEPFFNQNERICPQTAVILFMAVTGLYWSANLAEF